VLRSFRATVAGYGQGPGRFRTHLRSNLDSDPMGAPIAVSERVSLGVESLRRVGVELSRWPLADFYS
jgi:hypothetical protein